ncbi:MAG: TlpA family protein disulfide reductase [Gammaproteobacteria bacterium]|nr:TlpA family protein disulfide reductase [Gammaproteobacteria bacterium]NNC97500.1 TlpA family protein disulfide reductase [Gammaproteobacteria bacterium]NNM14216.1 TlpA family protein disulfide reductase [Gammaproteobacteria bacterium]
MKVIKDISLIGLLMLASALAGFGVYKYVIQPQPEQAAMQGNDKPGDSENLTLQVVPDEPGQNEFDLAKLAFKDIKANPVTLDTWQDQTLVINFWATWCPPCRKEIPVLIDAQEQLKNDNVQFLGIAMDDSDAVQDYMQTAGFNYPILISDVNETIRIGQAFDYDFIALPFTLFLSADGQIKKAYTGELNAAQLSHLIKSVQNP